MTQNSLTPAQIISFYTIVEKLKSTLRHSWLSLGSRQESVAEHTWMMSLLALVVVPQLQQKLELQKILKMIILHDLAEAITKDMPVWQSVENKSEKVIAERHAINQIFGDLNQDTKADLLSIWEEYELRESAEAHFVKALDTLDVIAQHNMAPIESWDDNDYLWQLSPLQDKFFDSDVFLRKIKDAVDAWSIKKVAAVDKLHKLDQDQLDKKSTKK